MYVESSYAIQMLEERLWSGFVKFADLKSLVPDRDAPIPLCAAASISLKICKGYVRFHLSDESGAVSLTEFSGCTCRREFER